MSLQITPSSDIRSARPLISLLAGRLTQSASPRLDASWLLGLSLGRDIAVQGHEDICLDVDACARLGALMARRMKGEPVSRLRGKREFWSHDFYLNEATLDPRADTECLVAAACAFAALKPQGARPAQILDLGTGSGCILLSLLLEQPDAKGVGTDIAALAIAQARANAAMLGVAPRAAFHQTSWCDPIAGVFMPGLFDIITSNPPYIESQALLSADVADYDPHHALFAGADGLDDYRTLFPRLPALMHRHARAFIEIGSTQKDAVSALAIESGLAVCGIELDFSGRDRCLILTCE